MRTRTPTPPTVRGWCPSVTAPLEALDGWVVRVPVGCRALGARQWQTLAALAEHEGNGLVELTSRGNVQLRGLRPERVGEAAGQLVAAGLATVDEALDRARAVVVNPLLDHLSDAPALTERKRVQTGIEEAVTRHWRGLPAKWWAVVDAELPWPAPCHAADVAVSHRGDGWVLWVAGRPLARARDPLPAVETLVRRCAEQRCRAGGLSPPVPLEGTTSVVDDPGWSAVPAPRARQPWWGLREVAPVVVAGASPPLGVTRAASLRVLAALADRPSVSLQPTTERGVIVVAPPQETGSVLDALDRLAGHGWVVGEDDPRRFVSACIGSRGCPAALVDTHRVAGGIQAGERTHVSGCPKRCGAPRAARELIATVDGIREHRP